MNVHTVDKRLFASPRQFCSLGLREQSIDIVQVPAVKSGFDRVAGPATAHQMTPRDKPKSDGRAPSFSFDSRLLHIRLRLQSRPSPIWPRFHLHLSSICHRVDSAHSLISSGFDSRH